MIEHVVAVLGLTRLQLQTLRCHLPIGFSYVTAEPDDLDDPEKLRFVMNSFWCVFINPRKLKQGQLKAILSSHEYAVHHTHAAILLFADLFTREQLEQEMDGNKWFHQVDLRAGFDRKLRTTVDVLRKATMICWDHRQNMKCNMFHDGWYLLDIKTTGTDPIQDDIISLSLAYMANYKIEEAQTFYIKQNTPISSKIESLTGITNEMLEQGITREELAERLKHLPHSAPIIMKTSRYDWAFLKALFHLCGQHFDLPNVSIDGFASIAFSYMLPQRLNDITDSMETRHYERTPLAHPFLYQLYDLTLAVFENLQERYHVYSPEDFHSLYYGEIDAGE